MLQNANNKKLNDILEKYFGDNKKWGANVLFDEHYNADVIEICKLTDVSINGSTWTHYAHITRCGGKGWEVSSQFNGKDEDELWVYAYYKRFADACRCVSAGKFSKMKPIKIY